MVYISHFLKQFTLQGTQTIETTFKNNNNLFYCHYFFHTLSTDFQRINSTFKKIFHQLSQGAIEKSDKFSLSLTGSWFT